jgi:glc operon protein GlcG
MPVLRAMTKSPGRRARGEASIRAVQFSLAAPYACGARPRSTTGRPREENVTMLKSIAAVAAIGLLGVVSASAQTPAPAPAPPAPYGTSITLEAAKKAMAAAEAEATKNNWNVVIAIVDTGGHVMMVQRANNTQLASIRIAEGKARTAVEFRRPSKALEDAVAGGGAGLRLLTVEGLTALEGGVPIIADGKIIGGIGVSGVLSSQDAQIAKAGADAAK